MGINWTDDIVSALIGFALGACLAIPPLVTQSRSRARGKKGALSVLVTELQENRVAIDMVRGLPGTGVVKAAGIAKACATPAFLENLRRYLDAGLFLSVSGVENELRALPSPLASNAGIGNLDGIVERIDGVLGKLRPLIA